MHDAALQFSDMDNNEKQSTQVTFRCDPELLADIDRLAAKRRRTRSDYIRLSLGRVVEADK